MIRPSLHTPALLLCLLSLCFSAHAQTLQLLAESGTYRLEEIRHYSVSSRYLLKQKTSSGDSLVQTFDNKYIFTKANSQRYLLAEEMPSKSTGFSIYNIFDVQSGSFLFNWSPRPAGLLCDTLFAFSTEEPPDRVDWKVVGRSGKIYIDHLSYLYEPPALDTASGLIYFKDSKDSITLFQTDGDKYRTFVGYEFPRFVGKGAIRVYARPGKYGVINPEGKILLRLENTALEFIDSSYIRIKSGTTTAEVFSGLKSKKCMFSTKAYCLGAGRYMDHSDNRMKSYFTVCNGTEMEYYTPSFELLLKHPYVKLEGNQYWFRKIGGRWGKTFFMEAPELIDSHAPLLVREGKIIQHQKYERVHVAEIRSAHSGYTSDCIALMDNWIPGFGLELFDKDGHAIIYRQLYQHPDFNVIEADLGKGPVLAFVTMRTISIVDGSEHYKHMKADYLVFDKKKELNAFSFSSGGKTGLAFCRFALSSTDTNNLYTTPAVFSEVSKVTCMENFAYIEGVINGRKCVAYAAAGAFRYIFPNQVLKPEELFFASDEVPLKVTIDGTTSYINMELKSVSYKAGSKK